jgi:hypothetical protein
MGRRVMEISPMEILSFCPVSILLDFLLCQFSIFDCGFAVTLVHSGMSQRFSVNLGIVVRRRTIACLIV